ncbi:hypothetical protein [Holophaga foetida]|uniref:hypothetical protein n=1 Tax=Holophaga foetida TaxID=35839 RepID=UPI00024742FE|nr:hypothetical protein [Holophaga foetida]
MRKPLMLLLGLFLLFLGAYSLPGEGLPYSRQHTARLGPFEASARSREKIPVPATIGWGLVVVGAGLVLFAAYKKGK